MVMKLTSVVRVTFPTAGNFRVRMFASFPKRPIKLTALSLSIDKANADGKQPKVILIQNLYWSFWRISPLRLKKDICCIG